MLRIPLAVVSVAGALALLVMSCGEDDELPEYPAQTAEPVLTAEQRKLTRRLLSTDTRLREALKGSELRIAQLGPWSSADHRFIGASAVVPLRPPRSYGMREWPLLNGDPPGDAAYVVTDTPMRATRVSELLVDVDLKLRRVVGINPGGDEMRGEYGPGVELSEPTGY